MTSSEHISTPDMTPEDTLPSGYPAISMDIALGKKYEHIDFDHAAFQAEAERSGLTAEDTESMPLHIKAPGLLSTKLGFYDIDGDKGVTVAAGRKTSKTIAHELKHKGDDKDGIKMKGAGYEIGRVGVRVFDKVGALGIAGVSLATIGNEAAERMVTSPAYLAALGTTAVLATGYIFNPAEVRARRAAKLNTDEIITFTQK